MNNLDILTDILEFKFPDDNKDSKNNKAVITVRLLNSHIKEFKISISQYEHLKLCINSYKYNIIIAYGKFGFLWCDFDNVDNLANKYSANILFSKPQYNFGNKVILTCNNNKHDGFVFSSVSKTHNINEMATDDQIINEFSQFKMDSFTEINSSGLTDVSGVKLVTKEKPNKKYDYQLNVSKLSVINRQFGLFMEPGTGKTKTSLDTACTLLKTKEIDLCIVIPLANLIENWEEEIIKHCDERYVSKFMILSNKDLEKNTKNHYEIRGILENISLNSKNMSKQELFETISNVLELSPKMDSYMNGIKSGKILLIIDEFHAFKNPLSQKSEYLLSSLSSESRILILSGTPFPKGFQDMFVAFKVLGIIKRSISWWDFKNFFFDEVDNGFGGVSKLVLKKDRVYLSNLLISRFNTKSAWIKKSDVLSLPSQKYLTHYYKPSEEQHAIIQKILNDTPIPDYVKRGTLPFSDAQLKDCLIRIMQIQGGFYLDENENFCEMKENDKCRLLLDLVKEQGDEQILIFCAFTAEVALINEKLINLGYKSVCKHGKITKLAGKKALKSFKSREAQILVATGDGAGTGLTLVDGCSIIYYSNNFNHVTRDQTEARIHRVGQLRDCTYHDLLSEGGIDEIIYNCVNKKISTGQNFFDKLKDLKK